MIKIKKIPPIWLLIIGVAIISITIKTMSNTKTITKTSAEQQTTPLVEIQKLESELFEDTVFLTGTIKGAKEIELKFSIPGRVEKFYFKEGDNIKKGQIIAQLDQKKFKLLLEKKRLELEKGYTSQVQY